MKNYGRIVAAAAAAAAIAYVGYYVAGIGTAEIRQYQKQRSIQFSQLDR